MLCNTSEIKKNGFFDEDFFLYWEDFFFHEEEHNALKGSRLKLLNSVSITRFISTLMESFFQHRDSFIRSRRFRNKNFGNYLFFFLYILKKIALDTGSIVKVFLKKDYKKYSKDKLRLLDWLDGNNDGIGCEG